MGLYTKEAGVRPEKSLLGCLVATGLMVAVTGAVAIWQRAEFVFGDEQKAQRVMAQRLVEKAVAQVEQLAEDSGQARITDVLEDGALGALSLNGLDVERQTAVLGELLKRGRHADAPVHAELRPRLEESYLGGLDDPWGGLCRVYVWESEGGARYHVEAVSAGENGAFETAPGADRAGGDDFTAVSRGGGA